MSSLAEKALKCYYQKQYSVKIAKLLENTKFGAAKGSFTQNTSKIRPNKQTTFDHKMPPDPYAGATNTNLATKHSPPPIPRSNLEPSKKIKPIVAELPKPTKPT